MIDFFDLHFSLDNERICLSSIGDFIELAKNGDLCEVQIAGENKNSHDGVKLGISSEGDRLLYVEHKINGDALRIVLRSPSISVVIVFERVGRVYRVHTEVTNISTSAIILEEVSSLMLEGIGVREDTDKLLFTRFDQSHHSECQPKTMSFVDAGFSKYAKEGQTRLAFANVGSWSSKEQLPQCIVNRADGSAIMFIIESNSGWYYEIADKGDDYYLYLGGANLPFHGWSKELKVGESYRTVDVAFTVGKNTDEALCCMTEYRRTLIPFSVPDANLPVIFNEYMHLSWDSPDERNTARYAEYAAAAGADYYVIDCGWHNEEPGDKIYPYVGQWRESKTRFPHGLKKTTDYIRSLGMKAGLWIEPEIIGIHCKDMLDYYDDSCFLQRRGKRVCVMNRYFLDFRSVKVRDYLTETIRRMIEDYGADYIKLDYNQDCGAGTDYLAQAPADGLEQCAAAYLDWVNSIAKKYPQVILEGCASGGMRMDQKTLSRFSLCSTSDQINCYKYPYIVGNIFAAVAPEQAAVWSYPVSAFTIEESALIDRRWTESNISDDRVALNMINSMLGRMHLAGHLDFLNERQFELVKEGVRIYKSLTEFKKRALPYMPLGFTSFGADTVCAGLKNGDVAYVSLYNLGGDNVKVIPINGFKIAEKIYPCDTDVEIVVDKGILTAKFVRKNQAVFLRLGN